MKKLCFWAGKPKSSDRPFLLEPLLQEGGWKWLIAQNDVRGLLRHLFVYTIDVVTYFLVIELARTILGSKPSRMLSDGIWRAQIKMKPAD